MIKIKTTPNLYGISLIGDYQDLQELWRSIGNYLQFFIENNDDYPYHEYEYLLSLNYDIRHAFMGCRGVSIEENNAENVGIIAESIFKISEESKKEFQNIQDTFQKGNMYFQVEILYPLAFHYMIALGIILDAYYLTTWFDNKTMELPSYDILDAEHDRAVIQHFLSLLWNNVRELFDKDTAVSFFDDYENCELYFLPSIYTDALLHCQMRYFGEMNERQKKAFLLLSLRELLGYEMLQDESEERSDHHELYQNAFENFKKNGRESFPFKETFFASLENYFPANKPMYMDDFDTFLTQTYGESPDDEPVW